MKKYIVLSVNDNPEYLFYLPLTIWAWRKFGWEPIIFYTGSLKNFQWMFLSDVCLAYPIRVTGYKSEMVAQISRLYSACCGGVGYFMTGDIDMIPLSNYWSHTNINENVITTWGRDLTDGHYPICYIGMNNALWQQVMNITSSDYNEMIKRDLDSMPNARSEDPIKRWVVDQDLITARLNNCGLLITKIDRGMYENGYPIGRVDRSAWTLNHDQFIDCHMPRGIWKDTIIEQQFLQLLYKVWPEENFNWFEQYTEEFNRQFYG